MTANVLMARLLQSYGGRETTRFRTKESRASQLVNLIKEAERCVEDLTSCVLSAASSGSLSVALLKEKERQLTTWKRRHQLLWRMKTGFEKIRPPEAPTSVQLEVVGTRAVKVKFTEPDSASNAESIVTKYKVEWSLYEDFSPTIGSREITNLQKLEVVIPELTQGNTYFIRVAAGNAKGYSPYQLATPPSATPSSWRDVDGKKSRTCGRLSQLDGLFQQLLFSRPPHAAEVRGIQDGLETPQQQRRQVKKSIKNLFTPARKFQKILKRGVFLACLLYNEDRVLVTSEDTLPIVEVDENYPSSLHTDFHWLMKVACTWDDVKSLRQEMEKSHSSSNVHFRGKLLHASEQLQTALGIQDLGQLYYKPLKDSENTIILCTVKYINDPKYVNNLSVKWVPLAKVHKKLSTTSESGEQQTSNDILISSLQEMIAYNQLSAIPLPRGLYLGYVKLKSSVDVIRVLVPKKAPNVLPYCRVRETPHVSCEEWQWLKVLESEDRSVTPTDVQLKFQRALSTAARSVLQLLDISPKHVDNHRIYNSEVIELSPDVSFILMLPPIENVCSIPGQDEDLTSRPDCTLLPVQIFEMIHMSTYQQRFISRYSRLSSILEMDTIVAHHSYREAFSSSELACAKVRLGQLHEFQTRVDNTWRAMRWIMEVLTFARDKQASGGVPLKYVWLPKTPGPVSPMPSPHQSPVRSSLQPPREERLGTSNSAIYLRITNSSSSFSLSDASCDVPPATSLEMRRCASTSRLLRASISGESGRSEELGGSEKMLGVDKISFAIDSEDVSSVSTTYGPGGDDDDNNNNNDDDDDNAATDVDVETPEQEDPMMGNSINISIDGSETSLSSKEDAEQQGDEEEDASVHSKDSACSAGDDALILSRELQRVDEEDEDETDADFFRKPSSSSSDPSICSLASGDGAAQPGVLRVYAAYDSGLPSGTSVRLHLTPSATARDVVDTVVKQMNMAVILKNKQRPIYRSKDLSQFCLVAVVGRRERRLSDSFQPLKLQNPWTKGKLYVRRCNDV